MDNFSRHLTYALLGSLGALPTGCFVGGLAFGVWNYFLPGGMAGFWPNIGLGMFVALVALFIGILPTFLYGAPAYAIVASRYRPSFLASLLIGALPGLALLVTSTDWATLFLLFGIPVAGLLHVFAGRRMRKLTGHGPNNSFKPKPLRGSA